MKTQNTPGRGQAGDREEIGRQEDPFCENAEHPRSRPGRSQGGDREEIGRQKVKEFTSPNILVEM